MSIVGADNAKSCFSLYGVGQRSCVPIMAIAGVVIEVRPFDVKPNSRVAAGSGSLGQPLFGNGLTRAAQGAHCNAIGQFSPDRGVVGSRKRGWRRGYGHPAEMARDCKLQGRV